MLVMRSWKDVPQDVLGLILNKLHLTDQHRFRAVCKNWRLSEDRIQPCSDAPWLINNAFTQLLPYGAVKKLRCELVDPYSRKSHPRIIIITKRKRWDIGRYHTYPSVVYDSKHGWSLVGHIPNVGLSLFLYNYFSNKVIVLPPLFPAGPALTVSALFTAIPETNSYEVLAFSHKHLISGDLLQLYIYLFSSGSKQWTTKVVGTVTNNQCGCISCKIHIDGKVYCLFYGGSATECALGCYTLADNTWELLSDNVPLYDEELQCELNWKDEDRYKQNWLTEMGGSLIMICKVSEPGRHFVAQDWVIFRLDRLRMRWILVKDLKNTVFFMTPHKIICHASLVDDDCLILHTRVNCHEGLGDCGGGLACYSFKHRNHVAMPEPYTWMDPMFKSYSFIQPPRPQFTL